ncbi:MAG: NAD(+)/NADH kinase [Lachnospiraceae bacterium]|nr:NAD(+)/NADH kinase [Lachnospiraceae bacterium]
MKNFVLLTNPVKDAAGIVAKKVEDELLAIRSDVSVTIVSGDVESPVFPKETECLIALGGDGTMLLAAQKVMGTRIPIIGVNLGHIGYLSEVEETSLTESLKALCEDKLQVEERMMLSGAVGEKQESALNDVVLSRRGDMQLVGYRVSVNERHLYDFYADGMIVSTPTGSTGYNLSAGGPIVEPSARLMVLTPVCPHTLQSRSIVLSPQDQITIEILPARGDKFLEVGLSFDGKKAITLGEGEKVSICAANEVTRIVKLNDTGFLDTLHQKMDHN